MPLWTQSTNFKSYDDLPLSSPSSEAQGLDGGERLGLRTAETTPGDMSYLEHTQEEPMGTPHPNKGSMLVIEEERSVLG